MANLFGFGIAFDEVVGAVETVFACLGQVGKSENVNYSSLTTGIILAGGRSITPEDARL